MKKLRKDGGGDVGVVVEIITGMITGIIVNDYRNNHRRWLMKKSSAPIQGRWPALKKMMGWWFCGEVCGGGSFGEGKGKV